MYQIVGSNHSNWYFPRKRWPEKPFWIFRYVAARQSHYCHNLSSLLCYLPATLDVFLLAFHFFLYLLLFSAVVVILQFSTWWSWCSRVPLESSNPRCFKIFGIWKQLNFWRIWVGELNDLSHLGVKGGACLCLRIFGFFLGNVSFNCQNLCVYLKSRLVN